MKLMYAKPLSYDLVSCFVWPFAQAVVIVVGTWFIVRGFVFKELFEV